MESPDLGQPAALSHRDLNSRFICLDRHDTLRQTLFRGWIAWPLVKGYLWHSVLASVSGEARSRPHPGQVAARVCSGLLEIGRQLLTPGRRSIAVVYTPRQVRFAPGVEGHPFLGTLLKDNREILECIYESGVPIPAGRLRGGRIRESATGTVLRGLSRLFRCRREIRDTARAIADVVVAELPELSSDAIRTTCRNTLAVFVPRYGFFRHVFRRAGVQAVMVFDSDMKCAEIAAAKSLGLPVYEVQHGMFNREEPEYSWTAAYRDSRCRMAVPDKVFVFGPLWRRELLRNGYWTDEEVIAVGYAAVEACRRLSDRPSRTLAPVRVLFPTQHYVRSEAVRFWQEVLELQQSDGGPAFKLLIKLHPRECAAQAAYQDLVARFPDACEILRGDLDSFELIQACDVVAGYTSFMLLEAVGVGRVAISLSSPATPGGLSGTFNLPELSELILHVETPGEFLESLRRVAGSEAVGPERTTADPLFSFSNERVEQQLLRHLALQ